MARKKKNESIVELRKRDSDKEMMDTSAPPMICDTGKSDDSIILETRLGGHRKANTMVFSMRMDQDLLTHIKQIAREKSAKEHKNISYQNLISEAVEKVHPMTKEK